VDYDEARAQFPVLEHQAYLNAGSNGPLPSAAVEAAQAWLARDLEQGRAGLAYIEELAGLREQVRTGFGEVVGASPEQIALTDSTTRGCQIVVAGLGLTAEDEVVTTGEEHFGLLGPLHASGARVVVTAADEDAILEAVTERTRLIAVSQVLWTTGRKLDVARLREAGLPVLVDGAQSAGAIPPELAGADYLTMSAQKWLCAAEPTGALFVRKPEQLPVALPTYFSMTAHEPDGSYTARDGARRFDSGWISGPILTGLLASLSCHPEWRYERAAEMAARCRELLEPFVEVVTPPGHSTLVSFRPTGDPAELVASLGERGVVVRDIPGHRVVRASCGWWTSEDDLERLAAGVSANNQSGS
jgi:L-cysteine/cystine lyase